MGEVIEVAFGTEREWQRTLERTVEALIVVGGLFGDEEALMRAKGQCVCQLLRAIVEDVPALQVKARIPKDLDADQLEQVTVAIREAALKGIETALTHAVCAVMEAVYDLCTSKLKDSALNSH